MMSGWRRLLKIKLSRTRRWCGQALGANTASWLGRNECDYETFSDMLTCLVRVCMSRLIGSHVIV